MDQIPAAIRHYPLTIFERTLKALHIPADRAVTQQLEQGAFHAKG